MKEEKKTLGLALAASLLGGVEGGCVPVLSEQEYAKAMFEAKDDLSRLPTVMEEKGYQSRSKLRKSFDLFKEEADGMLETPEGRQGLLNRITTIRYDITQNDLFNPDDNRVADRVYDQLRKMVRAVDSKKMSAEQLKAGLAGIDSALRDSYRNFETIKQLEEKAKISLDLSVWFQSLETKLQTCGDTSSCYKIFSPYSALQEIPGDQFKMSDLDILPAVMLQVARVKTVFTQGGNKEQVLSAVRAAIVHFTDQNVSLTNEIKLLEKSLN